jgi:hypothetical protein
MGAFAPDLRAIGERFAIPGTFVPGAPPGSGHIHDTWAVTRREHGSSSPSG